MNEKPKVAGKRPDLPHLLMSYFACKQAVHEFFGYAQQWRDIPISDDTGCWWYLSGEGHGDRVLFGDGDVRESVSSGDYYANAIYTQRHLPRWVYRTETHTMVCVDTQSDFNVFLAIFDNAKEITDPELVEFIRENA